MIRCIIVLLLCLVTGISNAQEDPFVLVLGVTQDGGYPHMGCSKQCCARAWKDPGQRQYVVSLALADPASGKWWLFEATPDIREQLHYFQELTLGRYPFLPAGIFITHAHIGHYTGLMELGREVMNTHNMPVNVLPRMKEFLEQNGPWNQLAALHNIELHSLEPGGSCTLENRIRVSPFTVPHRDEYSETAGFEIVTPVRKYLFIPDINKWDQWNQDIVARVANVDVALLDATFSDTTELPGRNMNEVPHPLVSETMKLFEKSNADARSHIWFIHMNHTNPLLWDKARRQKVEQAGYHVAQQGARL